MTGLRHYESYLKQAGRAEEFEAIRAKFSGHSRSGHSRGAEWLQDRIPAFRRDIEAIGIHAAPSFDMFSGSQIQSAS